MQVLLLFFGPPIVAALILAAILHLPFRAFHDGSRGLKFYFGFRVVLTLLGFAGLLCFKISGGYENLSSSEFSPIGTDGRGLVILWATVTVFAFGFFSLLELLKILGNRLLHDPNRKRSEHDSGLKGFQP
jgi:hypothetical protein